MKIINFHHTGGIDHLPQNTVSIQRPGPYGNPYSSKSSTKSHEDCVALHRIDQYVKLIEDKTYLDQMKSDLLNKDLGCTCKHPKRYEVCHGDNYIHILSDDLINRTYDKTVLSYLMDDLKRIIHNLGCRITQECPEDHWLHLHASWWDALIDIKWSIYHAREKQINAYHLCVLVAEIVVDLEAAYFDQDWERVEYRFLHVQWVVHRSCYQIDGREGEPQSPHLKLKVPRKSLT